MVESQPSKLLVAGSIPVSRSKAPRQSGSSAGIAQLVEHLICNQRVGGSSPSAGSKFSLARYTFSDAKLRRAEVSSSIQ